MGIQSQTLLSRKMAKPKVLLLGKIDHAAARKDWDDLAQYAELILPTAANPDEFVKQAQNGDFDGVVAAYRTFDSVEITGKITDELLSHMPKSLKFIAHNGAGYDQIDVPACTKHKVHVSNVPTIVDDATADTAVFLTIGALRNFNPGIVSLRERQWRGKPKPLGLGHDPEGKVLGILGMGGIGRNYARKMRGFGMQIIYHNRRRLPEKQEEGARYVEFEELLRTSDVLSLNLPLNPKTRGIISAKELDMMKETAILVNTARGGVIDEAALAKALKEGKLAGAGLDVYDSEPKIHDDLVDNPRTLLLPHLGTWTVETQTDMERWTVANVKSAITQGVLKSRVPEQEELSY